MPVLELNGTDGMVHFGDWDLLPAAQSYAIVCKFNGLPATGDVSGILQQYSANNGCMGGIGGYPSGGTWYINHNNSVDSPAGQEVTLGEWLLLVVTKTAGTTAPRFHLYHFGTDAWLHADGAGTLVDPVLGASPGTVRVGEFFASGVGHYAAMRVATVGVWSSALTDVQVEALVSGRSTRNWTIVGGGPELLADLNTDAAIADLSGNGHDQVDRAGTTLIADDAPPGWTFGIAPPPSGGGDTSSGPGPGSPIQGEAVVLTHTGRRLYDALAPLATRDADYGYALAKLQKAIATTVDELADLARDQDDGTPGFAVLFDPTRCPARYLPFAAQFVGVELKGTEAEADQRIAYQNVVGFRRGTVAALRAAIQPLLTGTQTIYFTERAPDADHFIVTTLTSETPDPDAVVRAMAEHEIGGLIGTHQMIVGGDFQTLRDTHADFADIAATFVDFDEVRSNPGKQ